MLLVRDDDQPREQWRDGVETLMYVSAETGSSKLTVFEQWCEPDRGAPIHTHPVEEVLRVVEGLADIWVGDEHEEIGPGESVIIPAGVEHAFLNYGPDMLHTIAILAGPFFEAHYVEEDRTDRRWDSARATGSGPSAS